MFITANLRFRRHGASTSDGHVEGTFSVTQEVTMGAHPTHADRVRFAEAIVRASGFGRYMTDEYRWSVTVDVEFSGQERHAAGEAGH